MWVPHVMRVSLWSHTLAVLSRPFSTNLDFMDAALGRDWEKCFVGRSLEQYSYFIFRLHNCAQNDVSNSCRERSRGSGGISSWSAVEVFRIVGFLD